jgi:iron complex transport system ATP-binding protein
MDLYPMQIINLRFSYNSYPFIENINFMLKPGEFISLIGPNGAGKSTILKLIMGFLYPQAGEILISGKSIKKWKAKKKASLIGYVPQAAFLPPTFTVRHSVLLGRTPYLGFLGLADQRDHEIVKENLALMEIDHLQDRIVGELSGGEQQRVMLARALTQQPDCLLLDEPTTSLDIHHQISILALIRQQVKKKQLAVLAVMHDLNLASTFSHQLLLINKGRMIMQGKPQQVLIDKRIKKIYGSDVRVINDPKQSAHPFIIPSLPELTYYESD